MVEHVPRFAHLCIVSSLFPCSNQSLYRLTPSPYSQHSEIDCSVVTLVIHPTLNQTGKSSWKRTVSFVSWHRENGKPGHSLPVFRCLLFCAPLCCCLLICLPLKCFTWHRLNLCLAMFEGQPDAKHNNALQTHSKYSSV